MEKIIDNPSKLYSIAKYMREYGGSYPTIKNALETGQLKGIKTETGQWRILVGDGSPEYSALLGEVKEVKTMLKTLLSVFGKA